MADNITTAAGTFASDDIASVQYQRNKIVLGVNNANDGDVGATNPLPIITGVASTATLSVVASSATSVQLLAANALRRGVVIYNDSTQTLYIKFGTTASSTSFTKLLATNAEYVVPFNYSGRIDGIWASANGNARITELTA